MGDFQPDMSVLDGEENLIAAAENIVKAFESKKKLSKDTRKILVDLTARLSKIALGIEEDKESPCEIVELLNKVQERIMKWEVDQSVIWDCGHDEAFEYLNAVDEARKIIEKLESLTLGSEEKELLQKAHDLLQTGMVRLEEEFKHLIVHNQQPFEPEHMSFRSSEDDSVENNSSFDSFRDDSFEEVIQNDCVVVAGASDEYIIPLVNPDVIPHLESIANLMFNSNYGRECSQAYISVRKDSLDDCLYILDVEKYSIEDVLKMEWNKLNSKIRKWVWAVKIFVRVYLFSEKCLSDQVFKDHEFVATDCFIESSKASILQLLNFGEAISVGPHKPEKLIRILDMYEVLADLVTDINLMYSTEAGSCIRIESQDILKRLGDCAKATFFKFENDVATHLSSNPFPGGGIHHLTKYVMNYLKTLTDYSKTLDLLLNDHELDYPDSSSPDTNSGPLNEPETIDRQNSSTLLPVSKHFHSLLSILEKNLDEKSKLYKDDALGHIFLMNNIHYMAEKVKCSSELRKIMGDDWIRKRNWKFQKHAMYYERASWSSILGFLKDDSGSNNSASNSISRTHLKDRLQSFYNAFEEIYKTHTSLLIPDSQLREDLRIQTSLQVIQAYRTFVGRHINHISDKHIKYSADELEDFLLDLFEGSQKSLHGSHRK